MKDLLNKSRPLFLPKGSVRALVALGVVAAYIGGVVVDLEIVTLVMGFYFGSRNGSE